MNLSLVEYVSKLLKANVLITINIGLLAKVIMIDIHFLSSEIFCYKIYLKEIVCQHFNAANQIKSALLEYKRIINIIIIILKVSPEPSPQAPRQIVQHRASSERTLSPRLTPSHCHPRSGKGSETQVTEFGR